MQYTVRHSAPPRDVFLTAGARAYQKHVLHGPETVSIFLYSRVVMSRNHEVLLVFLVVCPPEALT